MQCPYCGHAHMQRADRNGVEIDICPQCGGIWLDRGELEQLLHLDCAREDAPVENAAEPDTKAERFRRFRRGYDGYWR